MTTTDTISKSGQHHFVKGPRRAVMLAALMAQRRVSKELWRQLQPLIAAFVPSAKGGVRKPAVSV
jgi:hypothetical protein